MLKPIRLLGFAFANADMLFEINEAGIIQFATGAISEFVSDVNVSLPGKEAASLLCFRDGIQFIGLVKSLGDGGRGGPYHWNLADGRPVTVAFFRLSHNNGAVSCTFANPDRTKAATPTAQDRATGLDCKESFLELVAAMPDGTHALTLVDIPSLATVCSELSAEKAEQLLQRIGHLVTEISPNAAGRLSPTTFGAIGENRKPIKLGVEISQLLAESGLAKTRIAETLVPLTGGQLSGEQRLLALKHVVSSFSTGKLKASSSKDLAASFDAMVRETQQKALTFTDRVLAGTFTLAYQPIVQISTMQCSYCEALARFDTSDQTKEIVAFAESLHVSDALDVAVTAKILQEAQRRRDAHFAINLSGLSLSNPAIFGLLSGLFASRRDVADRLRIELTESVKITDVIFASQAIRALRAMGFKVGLDEFGVGASSLQYLHEFDVDFVKFDAALIRNLGKTKREENFVRGLVNFCRELHVETIAVGIEDASCLDQVKALGFGYGQGWHIGKPSAEIPKVGDIVRRNLHRRGAQEGWG